MGSDHLFPDGTVACMMFQSTLPHGERPVVRNDFDVEPWFQSTLPHGERQRDEETISDVLQFQSTLPHGERHNGRVWQ